MDKQLSITDKQRMRKADAKILAAIRTCWLLITGCVNKIIMQARRLGVIGLVVFTTATSAQQAQSLSLREVQQALAASRLVDLTHPFAPGIPHWPGFADEKRETLYWYEKGPGSIGSGFFAERFTHVGQWGMHVDPAVLVFQRAYSRSRRISQT